MTLMYRGGEMRSGALNEGHIVFNNKDLYKASYEVNTGLYITDSVALDIRYTLNQFQEYDAKKLLLLPESYNSMGIIALSISF